MLQRGSDRSKKTGERRGSYKRYFSILPISGYPAAKLGVKFVSPFVGWKENSGDSSAYLKEIAKIYKNYGYETEIIAAAVRNGRQISELAEAGIDIVTCGLAVYEASFEHPFTTHGLGIFREAWDSTATE